MNPLPNQAFEVSPLEAAQLHEAGSVRILDVREPDEWDLGHIAGALHVPLGDLPAVPVDASLPIIAVCHLGGRSAMAATYLRQGGYTVQNMTGGMAAWARHGLPVSTADDGAAAARPAGAE